MNIDRKYQIRALNPCSGNTHDEHDSILFLAKDKAVPAMLRAYLKESEKLGANPAHLESIGLLLDRVEHYQREVEVKIPDTDLPCEIRRCVDGEGISDNKQDADPAPSVPDAWKLVPIEPTEAMVMAFAELFNVRDQKNTFGPAFRAAVAAAPEDKP